MNLEMSTYAEQAASQLLAVDTVDPLARLAAAKALREAAQDLERACGRAAHDDGVTWARIAQLYGASKQAMSQRFAR